MNTAGDAAEQTFRIVIEETEFVIRIAGSLLKETIAMLYAVSKDNKQNSVGKTNLSNMLKNCKDIRIFTVQKKDLDKFVEQAKNYGIYYCALIDKKDKSGNGIVDIMVRGDDAPRVNRIVERFDLEMTDTASLRTKSVKENGKEEIINEDEVKEKTEIVDDNKLADIMGEVQSVDNEKISDIMGMTPNIDDEKMADIMGQVQVIEEVKDGVSNTFLHRVEVLSEPSLENTKKEMVKSEDRVSTRELLKTFANEIKQKVNDFTKEKTKENKKDNSKDKKSKKNNKKEKKRGGKKNDKAR